jgi:hypothetical protein
VEKSELEVMTSWDISFIGEGVLPNVGEAAFKPGKEGE